MGDFCPHCGEPMGEPFMVVFTEEGGQHYRHAVRRCKNQLCGYELKVEGDYDG